MIPLTEFVRQNKRFIVAHRGASAVAPENTIAALLSAIRSGVPMVEIDVQLTSDGHVVLFHDRTLGRTTSGRGYTHSVTYAELARVDAGEWFDIHYRGERVPLLEHALELLRQHSTYASIEIKPPVAGENHLNRLERITEIVARSSMTDQVLFTSFHHTSLLLLRQILPSCHTAAINIPGDRRLPSDIVADLCCEAFVCSLQECTRWRMENAQNAGLYVGVYTINTLKQLQKVLRYPVTALVSNHPEQIQKFLKQLSSS